MNEMTTTTSLFGEPVDITHKPKRLQGDSFRSNSPNSSNKSTTENNLNDLSIVGEIPTYITLERVIAFFDENSNSITDIGKLYNATANWLKELLELRATRVKSANKRNTDENSKPVITMEEPLGE